MNYSPKAGECDGPDDHGTIADLRDYGSIVLVFLDAEDGRVIPMPMDHRAFQHLLEGEGCRPDELVGRAFPTTATS